MLACSQCSRFRRFAIAGSPASVEIETVQVDLSERAKASHTLVSASRIAGSWKCGKTSLASQYDCELFAEPTLRIARGADKKDRERPRAAFWLAGGNLDR